ncbi:MAG: DUF1223 domain-containing protein [Chitinophagales bacterium]|nr:DUF1223 domain-containing protein [Chitinophagales bacterium]
MNSKAIFSVGAVIILMFCSFGFLWKGNEKQVPSKVNATETGIAVIELFTSEGCSSCPPADELLKDLKAVYAGKNVFVLAFHVDYWNYLGWKDRYGDATYSKRQQDYARQLNAEVYTPQMIVNGEKEFVGSNKSVAELSISRALNGVSKNTIRFENSYEPESGILKLTYHLSGVLENQLLNIAIVENETSSSVSRGENSGKKLHHVNVVRTFTTVNAKSTDEVGIKFPVDLDYKNAGIICYTQQKNSLQINGVVAGQVTIKN